MSKYQRLTSFFGEEISECLIVQDRCIMLGGIMILLLSLFWIKYVLRWPKHPRWAPMTDQSSVSLSLKFSLVRLMRFFFLLFVFIFIFVVVFIYLFLPEIRWGLFTGGQVVPKQLHHCKVCSPPPLWSSGQNSSLLSYVECSGFQDHLQLGKEATSWMSIALLPLP